MSERYLPDVRLSERFGVHRTTIWRWTKTIPNFPKPVKLTLYCSRWKASEIEAWENARDGAT